ncbi:MAG: AAA domain-containing protein, partial [Oscillospiraceae bacterium]
YPAAQELLNEAQDKARQLNEFTSHLTSVYEKTVFCIDYNGILSRYKTEYTSFLKVFSKNYKADKKLIQSQYKEIVKRISDEQVFKLVSQLRAIDELRKWFDYNRANFQRFFGNLLVDENSDFSKLEKFKTTYLSLLSSIQILETLKNTALRIEESEKTLIAHYQFFYKGLNTEWDTIRSALIWSASFRKQVEKLKLNTAFVETVCSGKISSDIYKDAILQLEATINNLDCEFHWYLGLFNNHDSFKLLTLPALQDRLVSCLNGLSLLEEWIDFRTARENCKAEGLADCIVKIEELHIEASKIIPVFKKRFFRLWLDAILPEYPAVLNFRRRMHENAIDEFARLDKIQFEIAKARIRSKLINELPSLQRFTSGVDEISILKRELGKQRRIMPIRKLFREIPNLLLTLKPCLMMSPLSVSLFLEAETYQFDTVIFDEASQVCTENAIGAISRGKQVIIAGDSKQLPPTNFFSVSTSSDGDFDDDDDEYDDTGAFESVLDEAGLLPERTLLWHYRSRHEHLIAFSNAKIYKNNLITFPANIDKVPDNGVEYIFVRDGFYDRGGKKGNVKEAQKAAEMVFEHFRKYPRRSLGVITFGEVQQLAIDTAIREIRLRNQNFESFFKEDSDEPFFIKNLENVQGDERDTIIFSIGYAKDAAGVFRMNFGPLSKSGGERRLNVAITRAKYNVKLIGSIMPTDIDIDKISSDGPKLLRAYIDFAINGAESLVREVTEFDVTEHDSPFEEAVYNYLDRKGYKVATQVGCSGYKIDMAVKHPTLSGVYVLGVECDGATYHSARTARERDRLRQEVLENMGWSIYRIWSTDWIKDPVKEGENLVAAINEAISNYGGSQSFEQIDTFSEDRPDADDFVSVNKKEIGVAEQANPYGFAAAVVTNISALPRNSSGYLDIADCIMAYVTNEYPIHYELLCQQLAPLYGNEKATIKVRREVDYGITRLR